MFSDNIKESNDGLSSSKGLYDNIFQNKKRQIILEYFRNLLKQNQISYKRIPWDKLDPTDFLNWPKNLAIKSPNKYRKRELMLLLSQLENIRWSERFLRSNSLERKQKVIQVNTTSKKNYKKSHYRKKLIYDHFRKLLLLNNIKIQKIQWVNMKKTDFINWPENLQIKSPVKYNSKEDEILLAALGSIRLSPNYLDNYKTSQYFLTHRAR